MVTNELVMRALRNSTLTEELRNPEIEQLASLVKIRDYKAGAIILQPNDAVLLEDALLILGSGEIEATVYAGADYVTLHHLQPGDLAGIIGFVGGTGVQISATVIAKTDSKVLVLERARFEHLLNSKPAIVYYVMRGIVRYIHGIIRRMNTQSLEMNNIIHIAGGSK
jgi:CRP-like cAMP-binding protein